MVIDLAGGSFNARKVALQIALEFVTRTRPAGKMTEVEELVRVAAVIEDYLQPMSEDCSGDVDGYEDGTTD